MIINKNKRRLLPPLLIGLLFVTGLALSLVRVPQGSVALLSWRGGGTPTLLRPGWSLRVPFLQRVERLADRGLVIEQTADVTSRAGEPIGLPYRLVVTLTEKELLALHREHPQGVVAALRAWVDGRLLQAAGAISTYDLASGQALARLEGWLRGGLEDRFAGRCRATLAAPVVPQRVRQLFTPDVIDGARRESGQRVVLVGLDGADWDVIDPMIERGELPHFAALKRDGAWGPMRSNVPTLSPLLWTTIATGKSPDRHGINDFLVADPRTGQRVPINSTFRRVKALWNILAEAGMASDVIAWWATWPAEPIPGHMISDRVSYSTFDVADAEAGGAAVFPPAYGEVVERLRVAEETITHAGIRRFLRIDEPTFRRARSAAAAGEPLGEAEESINLMARVLAATETYRKVALDILRTRRAEGGLPPLFAVYFQGIDEVNHRFAHCAPPRARLCSDEDSRRFGDAVAAFYRYQDEILGELFAAADGATVMVVSDHGFSSGDNRPDDVKPFIEGRPGLWHDLIGVFAARGPGIATGEIASLSLYDVAPTVLYLLGFPLPEDMPGKVAVEAIEERFVTANEIVTIPSYEPLPGAGEGPDVKPAPAALHGAGDAEMVAQLRALGYVGAGGSASLPLSDPIAQGSGAVLAGAPPASGVPTLLYHTNLAAVLLGKRQFEEAEAEYRKALDLDPEASEAITGLAILHDLRGEPERALELLERIVRRDEEAAPARLAKMAEIYAGMGRPADGVAYLRRLQREPLPGPHWEAGIDVALGMLLREAGEPTEAEAALRRALAIEPASVTAMQELFMIYDARGRVADLEPELRAALRVDPGLAMHRNWLGLVLQRRGDFKGAEGEFRQTIELAPELTGVMANLGALYLRQGRASEAVAILRQAVEQDPRNLEGRTNLISALGMEGDVAGARREVEAAGELGQRSADYHTALAFALHYNGRPAEALAEIRTALSIDPRHAGARRVQQEIEAGEALPEGGR
ncbi:MAG TPA: alkaline phosphatase family protein [Candidatus Polarisedimenticolia bacterium]|nr:alkaline phosphatase family protein [Candidatus Polarisedimenticolia bacterium]